ncbi:MAG: CoB--CoM heterodisulfide reductase iron-sulfur subunit B family protein [Euryarchaeota archaeon]|nr:CoB--CoM heterodisulfide reductase iron-sulfur subunit B family protein [Euryarchaeota archaeon]
MEYAYFLGCTIPFRLNHYDLSTRKVAQALGIKLVDIPGASCCGLQIESVLYNGWLASSAYNICKAEEMGLDMVVLCNGCHTSLIKANKTLKDKKHLRDEINEILKTVDLEFKGKIEIKHFVTMLVQDYGIDKIKNKIKKQFDGLNVGAHDGCHFLKPSDYIRFDDPEMPKHLDELIELTGAKSVKYKDRLRCCGGPLLSVNEDLATKLAREKLANFKEAGVNCIITICPFCNIMYDSQQLKIKEVHGETYDIPSLLYPQLLGLSLGVDSAELGLDQNAVPTDSVLEFLK